MAAFIPLLYSKHTHEEKRAFSSDFLCGGLRQLIHCPLTQMFLHPGFKASSRIKHQTFGTGGSGERIQLATAGAWSTTAAAKVPTGRPMSTSSSRGLGCRQRWSPWQGRASRAPLDRAAEPWPPVDPLNREANTEPLKQAVAAGCKGP